MPEEKRKCSTWNVCKKSASWRHGTALSTQPDGACIHAAVLLLPGGVEAANHVSSELSITEKLCLPGSLGFGAGELKIPGLAIAGRDLLRATRLRISQRDIVRLDLCRRQAHAYTLTA